MGSIKKRPDRRNKPWRARYYDPAGKEHAQHFERRVDAERWLKSVEGDMVRGQYVDPDAGRTTFGDYAAKWSEMQVHRPSTAAQVETNLRRHVLPKFGKRPLSSIRPSDVQAWVKELSVVLAPGTVELVYRYTAGIFRSAVADRVIASTPCVGIKLPKRAATQIDPLGLDVVESLIVALPRRYRALVTLAAGTGLRQGECFGLTVDRVDFLKAKAIVVDRQLVLLPGAGPAFGPPKTDASRRVVPMPNVVGTALAAHLAEFGEGPQRALFTNETGEWIRRTRFSDVWRAAVKAADAPGVRFHDLRHFYASLLIRHGESVKVVQSRLGHASAAETLDTYSHLWPDSEDRTRSAVDGVLSRKAINA